jgi:hypothetical protein
MADAVNLRLIGYWAGELPNTSGTALHHEFRRRWIREAQLACTTRAEVKDRECAAGGAEPIKGRRSDLLHSVDASTDRLHSSPNGRP